MAILCFSLASMEKLTMVAILVCPTAVPQKPLLPDGTAVLSPITATAFTLQLRTTTIAFHCCFIDLNTDNFMKMMGLKLPAQGISIQL